MATFVRPDIFSEDLSEKVHNLDADSLKWVLSNTTPVAASTNLLSNITQIATGGGYTQLADGGATGFTPVLDVATSRTGQVTTVSAAANSVLTATGAVGTFQWILLVNDTPTSPLNPVVGWLNHGSAITMATTDTYTIPSGALFTVG